MGARTQDKKVHKAVVVPTRPLRCTRIVTACKVRNRAYSWKLSHDWAEVTCKTCLKTRPRGKKK